MHRILLAFIAALFCHGLVVLYPFSQPTVEPPKPTGVSSITIDLAPSVQITKENKKEEVQEKILQSLPSAQALAQVTPPAVNLPSPAPAPIATKPAQLAQKKIKILHPLPTQPKVSEIISHQPQKTKSEAINETTQEVRPQANTVPEKKFQQALVKATPHYKENKAPLYPDLARRRGWEGTVVLEVEVLTDGTSGHIKIKTSSGFSLLDQTALKTVKKWYFIAGKENGKPVIMNVLVPVHFVLKDTS